MDTVTVKTQSKRDLIAVTNQVREAVRKSSVEKGVVVVFCPHTTAGVTINENADPDVVHDLLYQLDKTIPWNDVNYRHFEGNSAAHLQASLMGSSVTVIVDKGEIQLGTWQGIYFAEFDGPRTRSLFIQVVAE